ncbi:hypothetical protein F5X99DRAFT_366736 [Biscogniauxia marginata]|nr:hypothetical protein F5X99DRAFT_366736 [Biscogniauxia marginata]
MVPSGSTSRADQKAKLCHSRLLQDIKDFEESPYPKITLHTHDEDISSACLILEPDNYPLLHLTIHFGREYPLLSPQIQMNSAIVHPNVFSGYICASILKNGAEYTSAYTLKGIAIQLLSFFDSETLEQDYGGVVKNLSGYHDNSRHLKDTYTCEGCGFGKEKKIRPPIAFTNPYDALVEHRPGEWPSIQEGIMSCPATSPQNSRSSSPRHISRTPDSTDTFDARRLPTEVLLQMIDYLDDFKDVTNFARAWPRISEIVRDFDVVRQRELQCFCLKRGYQSVKLGVGVSVDRGKISSEFDLISQQAYDNLGVRVSVHNVSFGYWLPLPISRRHWGRVKADVNNSLTRMRFQLRTLGGSDAHVVFAFMNDIVVRLNQVTEDNRPYHQSQISTLRHASEKAIESYFHLFHLLICLATENPAVIVKANCLLDKFASGKQSKSDCPNLGHLLIALLISDTQVTEQLIKSIITETITRNVVWLLDKKGANMAELSFMEAEPVSAYRLDKTFQGSRTSYRLLMFSELFRRTARPSHQKPLAQVRDELFDRHGAPPRDAAGHLASEVRRLHTIDNFPAFLREMGIRKVPSPANFTNVLRETVLSSMRKGYSRWGLPRDQAMVLRCEKDKNLRLKNDDAAWIRTHTCDPVKLHGVSFFPSSNRRQ